MGFKGIKNIYECFRDAFPHYLPNENWLGCVDALVILSILFGAYHKEHRTQIVQAVNKFAPD